MFNNLIVYQKIKLRKYKQIAEKIKYFETTIQERLSL